MLYAEEMMSILKCLLAMIVAINALFLVLVFSRRLWRGHYFRVYDAARSRYSPTVCALASGKLSLPSARETLRQAASIPAQDAVHKMLLEALDDSNRGRISELLLALGYVDRWAVAAFGKERAAHIMESLVKKIPPSVLPARNRALSLVLRLRFLAVGRAIALFKLGQLAPDVAFFFAQEALRDPSFHVRSLAIAAIGRSRHPAGVGLLVGELHNAVTAHNEVSPRYIKAALLHYQMEDLVLFQPFLSHCQPRVRFFFVDAIREICDRAASRAPLHLLDFPPQLSQRFLRDLARDSFADVRARSACVIKHFRTPQATAALSSLLQDGNEYVRMFACRSVRDDFYASLIPDLLPRLADVSWRVREDAANSLVAFGKRGTRAIYSYLESCTDPLACEQVAEAIQRFGLLSELLAMFSSGTQDAALAEAVCRQMALLGMTSSFQSALGPDVPARTRLLLRELLAEAPRQRLHLSPREKFEFLPPSSSLTAWTTPAIAYAVARGD
jgi:hypothetical protein